jgi:hypothetical protein
VASLSPKPRSYSQRTPKKMIRLALRSALSDRAADDKVIVLDAWGFEQPSTKAAVALLDAIGVEGRILAVVAGDDTATWKSLRNLQQVHLIEPGQLNAYDVLVADYIVFEQSTLPTADADAPTRKTRTAALSSARTVTMTIREVPALMGAPLGDQPVAATADDDPLGEADDMAGDLPNRPKPDPSKASKPIAATDRVKSAADKPDPRFEAARQKAAKEDRLRAKVAKAHAPAAADATEEDEEEVIEEPTKKPGFSFNQTTKKDQS